MKKKITGILLLAGNSTRYGKNTNKNFELVNHKTVLSYSLNIFNHSEYISDIILVTRQIDIDIVKSILLQEKIEKPVKIVIGGSSRQESVYNALIETNSDIVLIHDGARPCLKNHFIKDLIECMKEYKGATVGVKAKDTIKIVNEKQEVVETTERKNTWLVQTPQCFDRKILLEMHNKYKNNEHITDDCMLLEMDKYKVKMIEGDYSNIKITTADDINIVRSFLLNEI